MNEQETRTQLIYPKILEAGWQVKDIREEYQVQGGMLLGNGKKKKPLWADYVLECNGIKLAVIEAKSDEQAYNEGVTQAKKYADMLQVRHTYSTNGKKIYHIDMATSEESDAEKFPDPKSLYEQYKIDQDKFYNRLPNNQKTAPNFNLQEKILSQPIADKSGTWSMRYYQDLAVTKSIEAITRGQKRLMLNLATGTGKTSIAFQICWKLYQSRWNVSDFGNRIPRILFLADRNTLADQAINSFDEFAVFEDGALTRITPNEIRKSGIPKAASIFFTIYQTFVSGSEEPYFGQYSKDFFDLVIIDECHRGGAGDTKKESNWQEILNYFSSAVHLGLTATPKRDKNVNTYKYFGKPVYTYSLKNGINDGFLTPYRVKRINTTIDDYAFLPGDVVEQGEIDKSKLYIDKDMYREIVLPDRERYKIKRFISGINQKEKSMVFCVTEDHAALTRDFINQITEIKDPFYCQRVTSKEGKDGDEALSKFKDDENSIPTVLTTSRKLSTGVDVPELKNIALMRPIHSMVEFKQIIGRGTRLSNGKDYFTIYDFVNASVNFYDPEWDGEPLPCEDCGALVCLCDDDNPSPDPMCETCRKNPCACDKPEPEPCPECGALKCKCGKKEIAIVKLSPSRLLEINFMQEDLFYSPTGAPINSKQYIKSLFDDIPQFFENEEGFRNLWINPDTRKKLLEKLADTGHTSENLRRLEDVIKSPQTDIYDILSYIKFDKKPVTRLNRSKFVSKYLETVGNQQRIFIEFVLDQYISLGVSELSTDKLSSLIEIKYGAMADAKRKLGDAGSIKSIFIDFQKYLYPKD